MAASLTPRPPREELIRLMARLPRRRTLVLLALALVAAGVVVGYVVWPRPSTFQEATRLLPKETVRLAWTDWAGVRAELDASPDDHESFLAAAEDADLTAASPSAAGAADIDDALGFNPFASEWELLGQSRSGMVVVFRLAEDADLRAIARRFGELGYQRPDGSAYDGTVWIGGPDAVSNAPGLGPEMQHVAFVEDERLLVLSDNQTYLAKAMKTVTGDRDGLDLDDLGARLSEPLAAIGFAGDYACEALSMSQADESAQAVAEQAIDEVGGLSPLTGYVAALEPDGRVALVFDFESERRARKDSAARATLVRGEDPGQMVTYDELFALTERPVDGHTLTLRGKVVEGSYPLTNLTQGPVLVAQC